MTDKDVTARGRWTEEVLMGYLVQIVSVLLMLAQHFMLPIFLGLEEYGRLAFTIGISSLLFSGFDYGYNLMMVRKPNLKYHYFASKFAFLLVAILIFIFYALMTPALGMEMILPVIIYSVCYITYTYFINSEIAQGRIKRVVTFSIISGSLLLLIPLLFFYSGIDILYAPVTTQLLSVAAVVILCRKNIAFNRANRVFQVRLKSVHLRRGMVKQAQMSFGTIIEAMIIWLGVVLVTLYEGYEAAAVYRIVMSALSLMTQLLPVPKQVLIRMARSESSTSWAVRYLLVIILMGAAQIIGVYFLAEPVLAIIFPDTANAIFISVLIMSPTAALKAMFELETVVYDRYGRLPWLFWFGLIAIIPAVISFEILGIYWTVLIFYSALCLVSTSVMFAMPRYKTQERVEMQQ